MQPIDVVLLGSAEMLSHIVKGILDEPDIRVSAELPFDEAVISRVGKTDADVVILAAEDPSLQPVVRQLLRERP